MNKKHMAAMRARARRNALKNQSRRTAGRAEAGDSANRFGSRAVEIADIDICYKVNEPVEACIFGMGFYTMQNVSLFSVNTQHDRFDVRLDQKEGYIRFHIRSMPLLTGHYYFWCAIVDQSGTPLDYFRRYRDFDVRSNRVAYGCVLMEHAWEIH